MPLSHLKGLDGMPFDVSDSFTFFGEMRPKRKLDMDGAYNQMETMDSWKEQIDGSMANPKRLCCDRIQESQTIVSPQAETQALPGCLDDSLKSYSEKTAPTGEQKESQPDSGATNFHIFDMEDDLSHSHQPPPSVTNETSADSPPEQATSMETDFVPDCQQYNLSPPHTPSASSKENYCGCLACKGLKPSPVTGRMHCHCYASWRGMYGIDCSFYNDYY